VELAETLGAAVVSSLKSPASFPTNHPLHLGSPKQQPDADARAVLDQADLVLSLEYVDPVGMLRGGPPTAGRGDGAEARELPRLILVSLEDYAVRSWVTDFQELPPAELTILSTVEQTVAALLPEVRRRMDAGARDRAERRTKAHHARRAQMERSWAAAREKAYGDSIIRLERLVGDLVSAFGPRASEATLARAPIKWVSGLWDFTRPGAYVGNDGGAGLGSGPGMSVGAALALRDSGGPVVGVLGDGDTLMASSAFWTAAHHRLPLLSVIANNRTYFNDEEHQERVARARSRPIENRWVGQRMDEPPVDFAGLAKSMGVEGFGPVSDPAKLEGVYKEALRAVEEGRPALVDVVVRY
jgi:thiamine pyrophosphate-dependent acetolactate synthase large subunit-like protein